ncbi:MAG: hypothetical protein HC822_21390 [Oscillochloris sp.]|nr:hypothetical protein [Oscillochloris sp.]
MLVAAPPAVGVSYKINATGSSAAAQLQATRQPHHLLIATLRVGGAYLQLVTHLRELYPDIRIILIDFGAQQAEVIAAQQLTTFLILAADADTKLVPTVARSLGLAAAHHTAPEPEPVNEHPPATIADLQMVLDVTRRQARAELVLFADNVGNIVAQRGDATDVDVPALTSLITGTFVNSIEMAKVLRDRETLHLSVHEGERYDVYSTNVGTDRLIALMFDKNLAQPRLGMVWLLMKRAAEQLRKMHLVEKSMDAMLSETLSESLNNEFDRLFGSELEQVA